MASQALADWWEHPHDQWYLKDDWKASEVRNFRTVLKLESPAASGWIVIWGDQGVTLRVNGANVMRQVDRGLICDTNLTAFVVGANEVRLESGPGRIVAEGELIDEQGRRYPFASGCDWKTPVTPGTRLPPAAKPYRPGESSGAFHSAHNGRLLRYNEEEQGKSEISQTLARLERLRDQSIFLLRRLRPAEEILSFSPDTVWRRAESDAAGPAAEAEERLRARAIPAQKRGEFAEAIGLARKAGLLVAGAELAINSARELEEGERQLQHLAACVELMTGAQVTTPPLGQEFSELRNAFAAARREARAGNWAGVQKRSRAAAAVLTSLAERLSLFWGAPLGKRDEFPEDRFGWLNVLALMSNDPAQWEFTLVPPAANWLDLRGTWSFRVDPANEGEKLGWHRASVSPNGWRILTVPGPWERQGVQEENDFSPWDCPYRLTDLRCEDKPYNGYAWCRREIRLPKTWAGAAVELQVGKVANWLRVFVNGHPIGPPQKDGGSFRLPADLLKPGETNTLAIQVYNHDNFGGIVSGPVSLALAGTQPHEITTPGPLSFTTETEVVAADRRHCLTTFSSAMSPAVVVASDQDQVHFWGWEAKGFVPPESVAYVTPTGSRRLALAAEELVVNGSDLAEAWLWVSGGRPGPDTNGRERSAPFLLVFEKRPQSLQWRMNELGFRELRVRFAETENRFLVLHLPDTASQFEPAMCRAWSSRLRAVPVACTELARLDKPRLEGTFLLKYDYLELADFAGQNTERVAPLPQLFSYAQENKFPALRVSGLATMSAVRALAPYRFRPASTTLSYTTSLIDKAKLLKGVGELFAKSRPELNARGGNSEQRMFDDWKEWGFDHCRYAFAWNQDWDIPLQKKLGGPINEDPKLWRRLDDLVRQHTDRGIMAMLCYFFNEDQPQRESRNLVRNSTRYWRLHPETRTNCYELWRRIAQRYAEFPEHLVAYDFFNEPAYMHQADWNQIVKDLTRIVRSVDRKHLIVVEAGDGWSQPEWFHWVEPTGDTNTIYSFHHYGKHWGYHYDEYYPGYKATPEKEMAILLEVLLFAIRHKVPIHCGEFGVSLISPGDDHQTWLDDYLALFERFGIGWNWWNWSGTDIYRTGLKAGDAVSPNVAVLRKWIDRKNAW